jgi:hypothetical protein
VIDVDVPAWVRTAADVEELHHPWLVALAAGLLVIDGGRATAGRGESGEPLPVWLAGLEAVLREESHDRRRRGAAVVCRAVLMASATDPAPARDQLEDIVHELLGYGDVVNRLPCIRASIGI